MQLPFITTSVAIYFCSSWYLSLTQVRGAEWFASLVALPQVQGKMKVRYCMRPPSPSSILDVMQGRLGVCVALALWTLLVTGQISRGWFYGAAYALSGLYGTRSFVAIATKRVRALRTVATMQRAVGGLVEDKKRRNNILKVKASALALDLVGVFTMTVVQPASLVVLGSVFSSRQMAQHYTVLHSINAVALLPLIFGMHVRAAKARRSRVKQAVMQDMPLGATVNDSALSVVVTEVTKEVKLFDSSAVSL
jgi:hypothetical protein